ncbi:hypothetical protein Tco_1540787 [Tanacetum coccineum]
MHDNIVPKPDLALELGKSISLTEAEEEAVAKKLLQEKFMLLMQELCLNLNPSPHKEDSLNSMAEQNVPAQPPTRTDEQIVPRSQWLIIGKSNLLFNAQKIQKNPIFQISVDILNNTNFFRAFTASASVPAIYMQQFWNTMKYDEKTGVYSCQVDEQWFDLSADLLRKALAITPVIPAHPFELPPSGNTVIDFVNELGYPEPVEIVSNIRVNYVFQPWRAILTLINQCLTGKTSSSDKHRHPVLQMLWGIVTQTNVDHVDPLWEERFSKVIIYYLASNNNIHRRPDSAVHHTGDDFILGNLKFVPKGETVKVFGMAIPDPLITEAIQQSLYYPKYLEMVAKNTKKTPQESVSEQPATKRAPPKKPTTTTPVKPSKPAPAPTKKPSKHKLPLKVRKGKPTFQLVDEDDKAQQEFVPQEEGDDPDLELGKKMSLDAHQEKGEGEGVDADMERAIKLSLDPAFLPQGRAPVGGVTIRDPVSKTTLKLPEVVGKGKAIKVIYESSSTSDSERTKSEIEAAAPKGDKEQGEVDSSTVTSGVSIPVSTQGQAGSDLEKAHEALARPDPEPMQEDQTGSDSGKVHVSLVGPNPEHMDDEFLATAYPKVHENLKLITDERVIEDNPESHSGSMSSMKNLEDTDNFGDQFLYDKPTEDDQEKSKVVDESDSTIPDPSHQTVTSTPLVIAPVTDFSSPKPSSLVTPPPINTEATTITTSLPSFIVSKKRSSDSSKKLKGIQTLTPAKQEAADIMKALKESKKMSKRQPGTGGSNEGTGNILGVPDESTIVSRASSEGTGSKPGVPDEEKLILEWEADVDSEHFDRDDNAGDDNEETKPDPEEIYKKVFHAKWSSTMYKWLIVNLLIDHQKLPEVEVKGKASATDMWIIASQDDTTGPSVYPEDATSTKMVCETLSHADAESGDASTNSGSRGMIPMNLMNTSWFSNSKQSQVALARNPNPEHMQDVLSLQLINPTVQCDFYGKVKLYTEKTGPSGTFKDGDGDGDGDGDTQFQ